MTLREEPRLRGIGISYKLMSCAYCATQIRVPRNRWETFKFCSRSCGWAWKNIHERIHKTCEICSKKFSVIAIRKDTAKYCSSKCYHKAMHLKGSVIYQCAHCAKEFRASPSRKRKYCSRACINKSYHGIWKATFITVRKNLQIRGKLSACERCGYSEHIAVLGVHHKDRDRTNNDLNNLEILCPNCHSLEHMKHIPHGFKE